MSNSTDTDKLINIFLEYLPEGTMLLAQERDTSDVWRQFAIWLLVDPDDGVLRFTNLGSLQYKAIQRVADLYIQDCKDIDAWQEAGAAAKAAATSAADAAWSADADDVYYAADAAWFATVAAVYAASADAAYYAAKAAATAAYAAAAAAWAADDAYAADAAWSGIDAAEAAYYAAKAAAYAAADAHYKRMANVLIELLQAAPLKETP